MSSSGIAFITPSIVEWAIRRAGTSAVRVAQKLNTRPEQVESWGRGAATPTMRQAQQLAHSLNIPFGFLFLSSPPEEHMPLPDFRTVRGGSLDTPSPDLMDVMNDVLMKQEWYREYLEEDGYKPLAFVGSRRSSRDAKQVAADITAVLGISDEARLECRTVNDFFRFLVTSSEAAGIAVMRSGIVGSNTHRPLSVDEFRGFVISDPIAPVVFVNVVDAPAAQVFTLVHELAHLWLGLSGVSSPSLEQPASERSEAERLCNQVAAEVLVPEKHFVEEWNRRPDVSLKLVALSKLYNVSSLVILRRAFDLQKLRESEYKRLYRQEAQKHVRSEKQSEGGNFYNTLFSRNSVRLASAVIEAASERRLLLRDAARLLNVRVSVIERAAANLRERNTAS
jgi:Zn-dependent peptidase ImmA (M78 family)